MALSKSDQDYIQSIFNTGIDHIKEVLTLTTDNIKTELGFIKGQTTLTNGRVNKLEEKELLHSSNCPFKEQVTLLWEDKVATKGVSKWKMGFIIAVTSVLSALISLFGFFEFLSNYKP